MHGAAATAPAAEGIATMVAGVLEGSGRAGLAAPAIPQPGHGEVRIRIAGCGVCASGIPAWQGRPWFTYPMPPGEPGHEGWGEVDCAGENVDGLPPGTRVAALSYAAFAEFDIARAENVVPLPDSIAHVPFPGEPLGCAMNIFRRSGVEPGQTVAIIGIGFLGALLTRLAANAGARVIALSRRAFSLDVAREMGASETIQLGDTPAMVERVNALTSGEGCDRVIEAVGYQEPLELAGELTRVRGRLVIAGYHQDGPRQIDMQLWNWRGLDVINAHERDPRIYMEGIRAAVQAVDSGELDPTPLYTHRFSLSELGDAFRMTAERPDGFMKALVVA